MNCGICRVLFEELVPKVYPTFPLDQKNVSTEQELSIDRRELSITASLSVLQHDDVKDLYRLDFKMRCDGIRGQRTFVLKRTSQSSTAKGDG